MALTPEEIAALNVRIVELTKARDSGALIVRHGETSVQYRSLEEIERIIGLLQGQIDGNGVALSRVRYPFQSGKGL